MEQHGFRTAYELAKRIRGLHGAGNQEINEDTIGKWLSGEIKRPRHDSIMMPARALEMSEAQVRQLLTDIPTATATTGHILYTGWESLALVPDENWRQLITTVRERLWILDYAPTRLLGAVPDLVDHLAAAIGRGADVRVLMIDPGSATLTQLDLQTSTRSVPRRSATRPAAPCTCSNHSPTKPARTCVFTALAYQARPSWSIRRVGTPQLCTASQPTSGP